MKKTIIAIALALVSFSLNAKEVATSGNLSLDNTAGVYSIIGKTGAIVLGGRASASETLLEMEKSFIEKKLSIGDPNYKVGEDEEGLYIIRIGLGGVKVRPADVAKFITVMNAKALGNGMKSGLEAGIKEFKKAMK